MFFCVYLLSQLSEPGRLGIALSGPASWLASAKISSSCDTSPTVDCCSFSICQTQSLEEEERTWKGGRTIAWINRLSSHRKFSNCCRRAKSTQGNNKLSKKKFLTNSSGSLLAGLNATDFGLQNDKTARFHSFLFQVVDRFWKKKSL